MKGKRTKKTGGALQAMEPKRDELARWIQSGIRPPATIQTHPQENEARALWAQIIADRFVAFATEHRAMGAMQRALMAASYGPPGWFDPLPTTSAKK